MVIENKAENYTPDELDKVSILAYEQTLKNLFEEIKEVCGEKVNGKYRISGKTRYIYIEGYYGSGKTFFLRKLAHEVVNKIENAIPIYVYLGADGIALGDVYIRYVDMIKNYVQTGNPTTKIIGKQEAWKNKIAVMDKVRQDISKLKAGKLSVEAFYEGMKELNQEGYCPILILDEFERLIYTGEGIRKTFGEIGGNVYREAAYFFGKFLELTRGHIFSGVIILATTRSIMELLELAISEDRKEHLSEIGNQMKIDLVVNPKHFPMVQPHIVPDHPPIKFQWDKEKMLQLAKALEKDLGFRVNEKIVESLVRVLPVPRALLNIVKMASDKGVTLTSEKDLYKIVEDKFEELKSKLLKAKTDDNRQLITANSKWLDRFEELLKNGIWYISSDRYLEVAKVWGIQYNENDSESIRKAKQKVNEYLRDLYNKRGLLDYEGQGIYLINKSIFAYLLGFERLPTGQITSIDNILKEIKAKVQEGRRKGREKRSKKVKEEKDKKSSGVERE